MSERITIKYHLKNGRDLNRPMISIDEKAAELIDNILTSQEYKRKDPDNIFMSIWIKISYITLTGICLTNMPIMMNCMKRSITDQ